MAGKMVVTGIDEVVDMLGRLGESAGGIASRALYEGAGVMADAMSRAADSIKTEPFRYARVKKGEKRLPSPEEAEALKNHTGIAHFQGGGTEVDTLVGFQKAGYVDIHGQRKTYRKAVGQIANAINSGTSFMDKQPVFRRAISRTRQAATEAIISAAEAEIDKLIK